MTLYLYEIPSLTTEIESIFASIAKVYIAHLEPQLTEKEFKHIESHIVRGHPEILNLSYIKGVTGIILEHYNEERYHIWAGGICEDETEYGKGEVIL